MRALLIVLGIFVLIGGLCIVVVSAFAPFIGVVTDSVTAMTEMIGDTAALEERYCNAGERVVVAQPDGGVTTTNNVSGLIFCEDNQGQRRDVSAEFFNNFTTDLEQSIPERLQSGDISFAPNPLACAVPLLGLGLLIWGIVMRGNNNRPTVVTTGYAPPAPRPAAPQAPLGSDLTRQLEQLDVARSKGLITTEEYERKRQQLLDNIK